MVTFLNLMSVLFFIVSLGACTIGGVPGQTPGAIYMLIAIIAAAAAHLIEQLQALRKELRESQTPTLTDRQP